MSKWATVAGVVLIAAFCALGFAELMQSHIPYVTKVEDVKAAGDKSIQFMGAIVGDTIKYDRAAHVLEFQLRDPGGARLAVRYEGVKPANFDSAPKAVVIGKYYGSGFEAQQVLTSCPSKYQGK
jgi:cytochrome c-type biogenesis protein CcmE